MRNKIWLAVLAVLIPALSVAQVDDARTGSARYSPPSKTFTCDLPSGWSAFEEQDGFGGAVHFLGPDDRASVYRAGLDIRYSEKGDAGYQPYKQALEEMKRADGVTSRNSTPVRLMRIAGVMVRIFEITETKRLPEDTWPAAPVELHKYVAVYPSGESYFTLTLSSTRESYMDYRDLFVGFLKTFRPLGYK